MAVFLLGNGNDIVTKKTKTEKAVEALAEEVASSQGVVKNTQNVVKTTTKNRGKKSRDRGKVKAPNPEGRNQTTPQEKYGGESYVDTKTRMKIYCEHHPAAQIKIIEGIIEQAPKNAKFAKLFVEMTGGTDPTETKITGEVTQVAENPLNSLSIEELRTLKALKQNQKATKKEGNGNDK